MHLRQPFLRKETDVRFLYAWNLRFLSAFALKNAGV